MNSVKVTAAEIQRLAGERWGENASEGPYCRQEILDGLEEILAEVTGLPPAADALMGVTVCSPCKPHPGGANVILADNVPDGDDVTTIAMLARAARGLYPAPVPVTVHKGPWVELYGRTWFVSRP